jgi:peptidoglycan LD-endopeptidase CwlK
MMNVHIKMLQGELGLAEDGIRGPLTTGAILHAADDGRLRVVAGLPVFLPRVLGDDIPDSGDALLAGVKPVLAQVIREASLRCAVPFTVIEGLRTIERQRELVAQGASKTMASRHLTGHAVDLWPLDPVTLKRLPAGTKQAEARLWAALRVIWEVVRAVAKEQGVMVEWGGDWGWDAPHVQLNRKAYP